MATENIRKEYLNSIRTLRRQCLDAGLSEEEFRQLYFNSLESIKHSKINVNPNTTTALPMFTTKLKVLLVVVFIAVSCIYNYNTIYTSIVCNLQEFIYPGLRLLRKISIPFLSLFPSLTEYYHESCLVQNPFFTVADMDCWPCSAVNNVREIHNPTKPFESPQNVPFIYETDQQSINMIALKEIYFRNKQTFDKEAKKIITDNSKYPVTPHEMFTQSHLGEKLYIWKFNTMLLARLLRQYIPRPKIVPKFGQSTERFIIVDSSQNAFKVPDTECTDSFLLALSGNRIIHLVPAEECKHQCKTLKVELKETFLLWYNWWYWRPVVQATSSNDTFIAHIGSYC